MKFYVALDIGCNWKNRKHIHQLIDEAAMTGADAVKFQYYSTREIMEYEEAHPPSKYTDKIYRRIREKELTIGDFEEIHDYTVAAGLDFMCTPFLNPDKVLELDPLVKRHKIRNRDNENYPLLGAAFNTDKITYVSMTYLDYSKYVEAPDNFKQIYCIPEYPANWEDLRKMGDVEATALWSGYSNHVPSIAAPLLVAAKMLEIAMYDEYYLEVHFKADPSPVWRWRNLSYGPAKKQFIPVDDAVSFTPDQVKSMVEVLRDWEKARDIIE